jgi:hypothetical protein
MVVRLLLALLPAALVCCTLAALKLALDGSPHEIGLGFPLARTAFMRPNVPSGNGVPAPTRRACQAAGRDLPRRTLLAGVMTD